MEINLKTRGRPRKEITDPSSWERIPEEFVNKQMGTLYKINDMTERVIEAANEVYAEQDEILAKLDYLDDIVYTAYKRECCYNNKTRRSENYGKNKTKNSIK